MPTYIYTFFVHPSTIVSLILYVCVFFVSPKRTIFVLFHSFDQILIDSGMFVFLLLYRYFYATLQSSTIQHFARYDYNTMAAAKNGFEKRERKLFTPNFSPYHCWVIRSWPQKYNILVHVKMRIEFIFFFPPCAKKNNNIANIISYYIWCILRWSIEFGRSIFSYEKSINIIITYCVVFPPLYVIAYIASSLVTNTHTGASDHYQYRKFSLIGE